MSAYSPPFLSFHEGKFNLHGHDGDFRIFSGAIHYFRVVPEYWQDRLEKAKACGLNTVETYVPWNLHEPSPGCFKNEGILDLRRFIKIAAEVGLYVIFRPGPFICAEWDFGGLPSWLLADPKMAVRSNYPGYQIAVRRYFSWLLSQVVDLQYGRGGPIIAVQVENEFGSYSDDPEHLRFIRQCLIDGAITTELLVTSDNEVAAKTAPTLPGVLPTANGQTVEAIDACFQMIRRSNPNYPLMVMELWSGWFDHWGSPHQNRAVEILEKTVKFCFENNASINVYMFHGGTSFGFMAGANQFDTYKPDITSYDYDAPLAEDGVVTDKYLKLREMIAEEKKKIGWKGDVTEVKNTHGYRAKEAQAVIMDEVMTWENLLKLVPKKASSKNPKYMEDYTFANGQIQSYGYVVYRRLVEQSSSKTSDEKRILHFTGTFKDRANILVNGQSVATSQINEFRDRIELPSYQGQKASPEAIDIVVENLGRVNYTTIEKPDVLNSQRKGLSGEVKLDDETLSDWDVFGLDFCEQFIKDVSRSTLWTTTEKAKNGDQSSTGPVMMRGHFHISEEQLGDYFVRIGDSEHWAKGIVLINGFNLGRYWKIGPTKTLYLPAPLLKCGMNEIVVFEEENSIVLNKQVLLDCQPCLG